MVYTSLNTCSTGSSGSFQFPSPGAKAVTIVRPTALIVSARLSRLGRFAGLALNIGTSGILSLVAVPTICRKIYVIIKTLTWMNISIFILSFPCALARNKLVLNNQFTITLRSS